MVYTPSRLSLTLDVTPMINWNLVPSATSYSFRIERQNPSGTVLDVEVSDETQVDNQDDFVSATIEEQNTFQHPRFKSFAGFGTFFYPNGAESLQEATTYVFSGTARNASEEVLAEFQSDLLVHEKEALETARALQAQIVKHFPALEDYWFE